MFYFVRFKKQIYIISYTIVAMLLLCMKVILAIWIEDNKVILDWYNEFIIREVELLITS